MALITIEKHGNVALVRLAASVTNPVNVELVRELDLALDEVVISGFRGLVLAGGEKFFSIGLDLPKLLTFNRSEMADFWHNFDDLTAKLYALPMPTLCAYRGHATAAGSVLATACDFRYAAQGKALFGFNELAIGLAVPLLAVLMLQQLLGTRQAMRLIYGGVFIKPEEALGLGAIDAMYPAAELEARALDKIAAVAKYPPQGFKATKTHKTKFLLEKFTANRKRGAQDFLECWFDEQVRIILAEAAKKF